MEIFRPLVAQSLVPIATFRSDRCNPFHSEGIDEPLKLTLHMDSLVELSDIDDQGLQAIHNVAHHEPIDVIQTTSGQYPHYEWGEEREGLDLLPYTIYRPGSETTSAVSHYKNFLQLHEHSRHKQQLLEMAAHKQGSRHIFVTTDYAVFDDIRDTPSAYGALCPRQAAYAIGLFLRNRNDRTITAYNERSRYCADPSYYYQTLARAKLAGIEHFLQSCMLIVSNNRSIVRQLAWSIIERTSRACQARDNVLICHLSGESKTKMAYHFEYLTISLVGVWDSLARLIKYLYMPLKKDRNAGFRQQEYLKALRKLGPKCVARAFDSSQTTKYLDLLHCFRNTIHGPPFTEIHHDKEMRFGLPLDIHSAVKSAVKELGGARYWGFMKDDLSSFQPAQVAERILEKNCSVLTEVASDAIDDRIEIDEAKRSIFENEEGDERRIVQKLCLG